MGGLVSTSAVINQVEHVCGEAESVAELFDEYAGTDDGEAWGQGIAEIDVDGVGEGDGADHWPKPVLQAVSPNADAAQNPAQGQPDDADGALYKA